MALVLKAYSPRTTDRMNKEDGFDFGDLLSLFLYTQGFFFFEGTGEEQGLYWNFI
jgi:hypothetical protein